MNSNNPARELLSAIVSEMVAVHGCHTVLLYGSRAVGNSSAASDYDICGFRQSPDAICDCREFNGVFLDAWIYPEGNAISPDESLLRLREATVLVEQDGLGQKCIEHVRALHANGPQPLLAWQKEMKITWLRKTLQRAALPDLEAKYRACWLLCESLQYYFELRGLWYSGSKESIRWLSQNDPPTHLLFENAFGDTTNTSALAKVVDAVIRLD